VIALLSLVLAAGPGDWSTTFDPAVLDTYFDGDAPAVLVAGGDRSDATIEATNAFETSLRTLKRMRLVMNGAAIGDPTNLSDEQLAAKAKALPIDTVVVIRVFPASDAPVVVASVLSTSGKVLSAFTSSRGKAVPPREGGAGRGVSQNAIAAVVDDQKKKSDAPSNAAVSEYDEKHIEWTEVVGISGQNVVAVWSNPTQGKYRRPITEEELYSLIGRQDLVEQYKAQSTKKTALLVGGGVALGLGSLIGVIPLISPIGCTTYSGSGPSSPGTCVRSDLSATWVGLGVAGAGAIVMLIGTGINTHPLPLDEARRLSDTYNNTLKKSALRPSMRLDVVADSTRLGLSISGSF
jgi:hypothetical protein